MAVRGFKLDRNEDLGEPEERVFRKPAGKLAERGGSAPPMLAPGAAWLLALGAWLGAMLYIIAISPRYGARAVPGLYVSAVLSLSVLLGCWVVDRWNWNWTRQRSYGNGVVVILGLVIYAIVSSRQQEVAKLVAFPAVFGILLMFSGVVALLGKIHVQDDPRRDRAFVLYSVCFLAGMAVSDKLLSSIEKEYWILAAILLGVCEIWMFRKLAEVVGPIAPRWIPLALDEPREVARHRTTALAVFAFLLVLSHGVGWLSADLHRWNLDEHQGGGSGSPEQITVYLPELRVAAVVMMVLLFGGVGTWSRLGRRGAYLPIPFKAALVCLLLAFSCLLAELGPTHGAETAAAETLWNEALSVLSYVGSFWFLALGFSTISRLAPARHASLLMGCWLMVYCLPGACWELIGPRHLSSSDRILGLRAAALAAYALALALLALAGRLHVWMHGADSARANPSQLLRRVPLWLGYVAGLLLGAPFAFLLLRHSPPVPALAVILAAVVTVGFLGFRAHPVVAPPQVAAPSEARLSGTFADAG